MITTLDFGVDFLYLMSYLQFNGDSSKLDAFDRAVVWFLLFQWGLTAEEVDEAQRLFTKRIEISQLGPIIDVIGCLAKYAIEEPNRKMQLVMDLAAVVVTQKSQYTDVQKTIVSGLQELLDMRPSEFQTAFARGVD